MSHEELTGRIIAAAIEVHRHLGPGLLEAAYEKCLAAELEDNGIRYECQKPMAIEYKRRTIDCGYRPDFIVEKAVIIELKAVRALDDIHKAQLLSYLKLSNLKVGLLINFNVTKLVNGIVRIAN